MMSDLKGRNSAFVFLLCVFLPFVLSASNGSDSCIVDEIEVQSNFDIEKFMGKWYEILWIPHEPESWWWIDFTIDYQSQNGTKLQLEGVGRPKAGEECKSFTNIFNITDVPGKFKQPPNGILPEIDYWAVSTDYDNYLFIYGCIERNQDDTKYCADGNIASWVFSRQATLADVYMQKVDELIDNLCINKTHYQKLTQKNDCVEDISGSPELFSPLNLLAVYVFAISSLRILF